MKDLVFLNSPATSAVVDLAESLDAECTVASYRENFVQLWKLDAEFFEWLESGRRTLVVVWDETPRLEGFPGIPLRDYLTAFDWAVALHLLAAERQRGETPKWRVLLFDLASGLHPRDSGVALARGGVFVCEVFRPSESAAFLAALGGAARPRPLADSLPCDVLRRIWADRLVSPVSPADRHAISNLVGPRILLTAMQAARTAELDSRPASAAFDTLLKALRLVPRESYSQPAPWIERSEWEQWIGGFLLVDDLHDVGWESFLRAALDVGDADNFRASGDIAEELAIDISPPRLRLSHNPPGNVLFLDLRLFARHGVEAEFAFLTKLLEAARRAPLSRGDLPWPGFSPAELDVIARTIDSRAVETSGYHLALTLLPRLLALGDPWMPIVLFSSTGRREIVEALQPYGNVILRFDKPRLFGPSSDSLVEETRLKFVDAVRQAIELARARVLRQRLEERCMAPWPGMRRKADSTAIVDIFIDHTPSGPNLFAVGGIALIYPDSNAERAFTRSLNAAMAWGLAEDQPPKNAGDAPPADYRHNELGEFESQIRAVDAMLRNTNTSVAAFALVNKRASAGRDESAIPPMLRETEGDNLYRRMLAEILETVLFDLVADAAPASEAVRVDVGTRAVSFHDRPEKLDDLRRHFGIGASPDKSRYYSLSAADAYPIVAGVLTRRSSPTPKVNQARGVTLHDYKQLNEWFRGSFDQYRRVVCQQDHPRPRQIHFLARAIPRLAVNSDYLKTSAESWFRNGFFQIRNAGFQRSLAAARIASRQDWAEALGMVLTLPAETGKRAIPAPTYEELIAQKAVGWLKKLNGPGILDLCHRLRPTREPSPSAR